MNEPRSGLSPEMASAIFNAPDELPNVRDLPVQLDPASAATTNKLRSNARRAAGVTPGSTLTDKSPRLRGPK